MPSQAAFLRRGAWCAQCNDARAPAARAEHDAITIVVEFPRPRVRRPRGGRAARAAYRYSSRYKLALSPLRCRHSISSEPRSAGAGALRGWHAHI